MNSSTFSQQKGFQRKKKKCYYQGNIIYRIHQALCRFYNLSPWSDSNPTPTSFLLESCYVQIHLNKLSVFYVFPKLFDVTNCFVLLQPVHLYHKFECPCCYLPLFSSAGLLVSPPFYKIPLLPCCQLMYILITRDMPCF